MKRVFSFLFLFFLHYLTLAQSSSSTFEINNGHFLLNNKEFIIHSGELHYSRVPKEYWKHRLQMMKAMGLNTVTTYVFWNYHEEKPGVWNWKGEKDLKKFIKTAQEIGLFVIIRPGPYVCAEWDFGGYPWWLQNDKNIEIRTDNPAFLKQCGLYIQQLANQIKPLEINNGGPIILVQVENEFGSYVEQRKDISLAQHQSYSNRIKEMILNAGITSKLFTSDASYLLQKGSVSGALPTANGEHDIANLKKSVNLTHNNQGPYMVAEYYPGWLDHWAEPFPKVSTEKVVAQSKKYLENGISFNYYMVHGGTNFGFWAGANYDNNHDIQPDLTSYDYDAPISEPGWATEKYKALRNLFQSYSKEKFPVIPPQNKVIDFEKIPFTKSLPLFDFVKSIKPITNPHPLSFEALGQGYGFVLYRTKIVKPIKGKMDIKGLRDYANIFVNGKWVGELNRYYKKYTLDVDIPANAQLDILVENMGRINWGAEIVNNLKGIISPITINDAVISENWAMYKLPFEKMPKINNSIQEFQPHQPILKEANFNLKEVGDTFVDMRGFGKGIVFVNGRNIGRYWSKVGPQLTLYVPGVWLKKGENTIQIFEQINDVDITGISAIKTPIVDQLIQ
jgi:beta-galactosidase